ncbi:MAG: hypothetical protein LBU89_11615 [Fibromonadaceae bacterium]|jgi:hypothetical protein|nr:hypothetical protein [Fibromonadaceae bacterium]
MRFLPLITLLACAALAADVSFEGTLEADYGNYLEKNFKNNNRANHDLRLKMNIDMDENVRAVVGTASKSFYVNSAGLVENSRIRHKTEATPISSDSLRWTAFEFDGISLEWTVSRGLTFIFGDLLYSFGAFNYYFWRNPDYYAAILPTQRLRGLGVRMGEDGYVYLGASDSNDKSGRIAASYAFLLPGFNKTDNRFTMAPMFDFVRGGGERNSGHYHNYTFGVDANYSRSYTNLNYALRGIYGMHPSSGNLVNTFTLEPSFNYKSFSLASTCYWALLSSDEATGDNVIAIDDTYTPNEKFIYVEPSFSFNRKFSMGMGFEWHKPGAEEVPDWFLLAPTGYLYPTAGVDLAFWISYAMGKGNNLPGGFGISSSVKF